MKSILEIQNISKKFRINHEQEPYLSLRDSLSGIFKNKSSKEDFWALKDVSFDVMPGDTIGIIGKNGAGKSTLLKILSKITPPTSGKIISRGRIASLLEVGTGFHPELSGRENVFMNGSILGMRRAEIQKNFDAIVDFAGVEKFIDEPLKHYSSGMQLRLAFAVAAFLENEILIIDEVLAVGDTEFQKKCMGKMGDISKSGRTILFVSHNMGAVQSLCDRGIILEKGALSIDEDIRHAVSYYLRKDIDNLSFDLNNRKDRVGHGLFKFTSIVVKNKNGHVVENVLTGDFAKIELTYEVKNHIDITKLVIGILFQDEYQKTILSFISDEMNVSTQEYDDRKEINLEIESLPLRGGKYSIKLFSSYNSTQPKDFSDVIEDALSINIISTDFWKEGKIIRNELSAVAPAKLSFI